MKITAHQKSPLIYHIFFLILLSIILLIVKEALITFRTVFDWQLIKSNFIQYALPLIIGFLVLLFSWFRKHTTLMLFIGFSLFIIFELINTLIVNFNNTILIVTFFYIVIVYFFSHLILKDLSQAFLNPSYSKYLIYPPDMIGIPCKIKYDKVERDAFITNYDELSCFFFSNQDLSDLKLKRVSILIDFENMTFKNNGQVVSSSEDGKGAGVIFSHNETGKYSWYNLHKLFEDYGVVSKWYPKSYIF